MVKPFVIKFVFLKEKKNLLVHALICEATMQDCDSIISLTILKLFLINLVTVFLPEESVTLLLGRRKTTPPVGLYSKLLKQLTIALPLIKVAHSYASSIYGVILIESPLFVTGYGPSEKRSAQRS